MNIKCSFKNNLHGSSVTFSVSDILDATGISIYDATVNHDPDGDSNGTAITLSAP